MYIYIHDENFNTGRYFKIWNKILARLNTLGIYGRKMQITPFSNNLTSIFQSEFKKEKHTLVVVGNDKLFLKIANTALKFDNFVLAYIPLEKSYLSTIFGIPPHELACDILSARITYDLDAISINNEIFSLSPIILNMDNLKIANSSVDWVLKTIDKNYQLYIEVNNQLWFERDQNILSNFNDFTKLVNLILYKEENKKYNDFSFVYDKEFFIKDRKEKEIVLKDFLYKNKIFHIKKILKKIKVIVGKNRKLV